jgi:hypothetical protein
MSDYIKKLAQMKSDIGVIQDAIFFEFYNMEAENKRLREVLEMVEDNSKITEVMHGDAWTLEYLAKRAREVLNKEKE